MADLLPVPKESSKATQKTEALARAKEHVLDLLADGHKPNAIANKLAKGDKRKARRWRMRIRRWAYGDELFQQGLAHRVKGESVMALPGATQALIKRTERGRVDAIKLLYESTGYHNPRVQHEHSGEVKIEITNMPRPEWREPEDPKEPVVDAEVVEEEE